MKKIIVPLLMAAILTAAAAAPAAQQAPDAKQSAKVFIPKEVKEPMEAGMAAKTARLDLPFEIFRTQYLPAQQAFYQVFFLKIKNADLGFAPVTAPAVVDPAAPIAPAKVKAVVNVFVQFHQAENGVPGKLIKEIYIPASFEADQAGFDPEQADWYTVGYPLMPGEYLATIAICSQDLSKIGIQYSSANLPDPKSFTSSLDTTPVFFMKEYKQVQAPEQKPEMHKGFFAYSVIQVTPSLDNVFTVGQPLDLFTYVFGCQPKSGSTYDVEIVFEVNQGDKPAIKFAPGNFDSPLISLPLTLKQTLQIKQGDQVRSETRDLPAGSYTFVMKIKDKVSGNVGEKKIDF
ncbi:MAG: hypothetical protein NTZ26_15260, partial [Candidatus Aminicenantes bacterium]|nr:hypothetical protein [Candidatus Aminicenantes bacterium]